MRSSLINQQCVSDSSNNLLPAKSRNPAGVSSQVSHTSPGTKIPRYGFKSLIVSDHQINQSPLVYLDATTGKKGKNFMTLSTGSAAVLVAADTSNHHNHHHVQNNFTNLSSSILSPTGMHAKKFAPAMGNNSFKTHHSGGAAQQ